MDHTGENYSAKNSQTQPFTSTETKDLFKKLRLWREESNMQLYKIMNLHSRNIDNRIRDLVEEVGGLKTELSEKLAEQKGLLETIDTMDNEIMQLKAKLQATKDPEHYIEMDIQEIISGEDFPYKRHDKRRPKNSNGYDEQEASADYVPDEASKKQSEDQFNDSGLLIESSYTYDGIDNVETDLMDSESTNVEMLFQTSREGTRGPNISRKQEDNSEKGSMKQLIKAKLRTQVCQICDYAATDKGNLDYHKRSVHQIGEMFKCNECSYKSASRGNLKTHEERVHKNIRRYACGECDFTGYRKSELKKHKNRCKYSKLQFTLNKI